MPTTRRRPPPERGREAGATFCEVFDRGTLADIIGNHWVLARILLRPAA
jgi:hypothetical protein